MTFTKPQCKKWLNNKGKNPVTGANIKYNGPTYRDIKKRCYELGIYETKGKAVVKRQSSAKAKRQSASKPRRSKGLTGKYSMAECTEWLQDKTHNPRTGAKIDRSGPTYRAIAKQCYEHGIYQKRTSSRKSKRSVPPPKPPKPSKRAPQITDADILAVFGQQAQGTQKRQYPAARKIDPRLAKRMQQQAAAFRSTNRKPKILTVAGLEKKLSAKSLKDFYELYNKHWGPVTMKHIKEALVYMYNFSKAEYEKNPVEFDDIVPGYTYIDNDTLDEMEPEELRDYTGDLKLYGFNPTTGMVA